MKPEALKNAAARSDSLAAVMGSQLGVALQAHHQQMTQAAAAANKVATSMANMNLRSHVAGHGGPVGMPQQASTPGPTYSPTPIQRPQGKYKNKSGQVGLNNLIAGHKTY